METIYNNAFLNSLFTSDEFNFIKNMDSDSIMYDNMLKNEKDNRDLIVSLINELNDAIYFHNINREDSEEETDLLSQSKKIFELINNNISILQLNKEISDSINKEIMNLLIKIDSDGNNISESKYITEITALKNQISEFSSKADIIKKSVESNDITIDDFYKKEIVQKYLKKFAAYNSDFIKNTITSEETDIVKDNPVVPTDIVENNNCLLVSETSRKVYLPYSKQEVLEYLEKYPNQYTSFEDVVKKEFISPIDFYLKHPVISRFRETYSLIRDREAKSVIEAFKTAMDIMFHYDLNPAIIAACKSEEQLEDYIKCLKNQKLDDFTHFEIKFEVTPLKM